MNEELNIKIAVAVDEARRAVKAVTKDLGLFQDQTEETSVSQEKLTQKVKDQKQQLGVLKKEYTNIVSAQGKESAAALACAAEISALSASYASNLAALNGVSTANGVYGATAIQAAAASKKLGTAAGLSGKEFQDFMQTIRTSTRAIDKEVDGASEELMKLLGMIELLDDEELILFDSRDDYQKIVAQIEEIEGAIREVSDAASDGSVETQKSMKRTADSLNKVQTEADDTSDSLSKIKMSAKIVGGAIATAFKAALVAITGAAVAVGALSESTREYRTEQAKLITAFETAGGSAEQAKETYNDLYRVLGDDATAVEAANHLAKLTTSQEDLAEYTRICQGVYATFGDSLPIESLTEAINETAKTGEITGALADAVNWAGMSEDEFAEQLFWCNNEAEREALIRNTLNGLYGEASEQYEENAASILAANEAQAKLTQSLADLGAAVEPIVTIFKSGFADALAELVPHLQLFAQGFTDSVNGVEGGAAKMEEGIAGMMTSVIAMVTELLPSALSLGIEVITAIITGLVESLPGIMDALATAIPQIVTALGELIPLVVEALLNALPMLIDVVFQAVAQILLTLGTILPDIVIKVVEILPQIVQSIVENIPVLLQAAIDFLLAIVDAIPVIIPELIKALPQIIDSVNTALIEAFPLLLDGAYKLFFALVDAIPLILPELLASLFTMFATIKLNMINKLGDIFAAVLKMISSYFSNVGGNFTKWFSNAAQGIKNAFSTIGSFFSNLWSNIKKIFSNVGATIGNAITNTVKSAINGVLSTATKIINGFIGAINTAISVINAIPGVSIKKLEKLNVPKLERGGVLKKGQVGLLEGNGAEAVVPLEKNTEWLDKIAARLSDAIGGNKQPIVLQVDGKTFARTAVSTMNSLTRQEGRLGLNLI